MSPVFTFLLALSAPAQAGCQADDLWDRQALTQRVARAIDSYQQRDLPRLRALDSELSGAMDCLQVRVDELDVAWLHVVHALAAQQSGSASVAGFLHAAERAGLKRSDVELRVGDEDPVLAAWPAAEGTATRPDFLPAPRQGTLSINGKTTSKAPRDHPYLLQHLDTRGTPLRSVYVAQGDDRPRYARLKPTLGWASVASGVVAGGFLGWAALEEARLDQAVPEDQLDDQQAYWSRVRARNNLALVGAGLTGAGAAGLGIAWFATY